MPTIAKPSWWISAASRRLRCWSVVLASVVAAVGLVVAGYQWWTRPRPTPPTEIYRGVTYACFETNEPECSGQVHIVRVDLAAPGIELYLTPLDPDAVARGYQYRLDTAPAVLEREDLAVVVNGTFFSSDSTVIQCSGDLARSLQTIVADGQVSRIDPDSYLLWFESNRTPHLEFKKPPRGIILQRARWGIGGGAIPLWKGVVRKEAASHEMDRRTAVCIDAGRRLLWLAVFENASSAAVARVLAEQGGQDGFLLDGGHSTTMVLGPKASRVQTGTLLHGWRPVATFFGVKANPVQ